MTVKELLEKRAKLVAEARAIYKKAEDEKRDVTSEEIEQFDKMMAEVDNLKDQADRQHRLESIEQELETSQGRKTQFELADEGTSERRIVVELRKGIFGESRDVIITGEQADPKVMAEFRRSLTSEARALQKDSDTGGGFLSAPEQFQAELIKDVDNRVFVRQRARVLPPLRTADSLGVPSLDTDISDPVWTAELGTGDEDSSLAFGKRALTPHPLAKRAKISKTLIRRSTLSADAIVRERLAYKFGVVQENAFLNGSGAMQPLGVFTASSDGISTNRDVSTGNISTDIRFDGLMEALYSLKAPYRMRATWTFHRDGVKRIRKLKDGEGRYIWQASVQVGQPDRILNLPVDESEYVPNTFSAGKYVGLVSDWSYYWIVDALTLQIQVLLELYAETNQTGYIGRLEADGAPVLENAFARVKLP